MVSWSHETFSQLSERLFVFGHLLVHLRMSNLAKPMGYYNLP